MIISPLPSDVGGLCQKGCHGLLFETESQSKPDLDLPEPQGLQSAFLCVDGKNITYFLTRLERFCYKAGKM